MNSAGTTESQHWPNILYSKPPNVEYPADCYPNFSGTDVNTMEIPHLYRNTPPEKGFRGGVSELWSFKIFFFSLLSFRLFRCDKEDYTIYLGVDSETFVQFV